MTVILVCWCAVRAVFLLTTMYFVPDVRVIYWSYPLTWMLSAAVFLVYYAKGKWMNLK